MGTGLGTSRFSAVVSNFGNRISPSGSVTLNNGQLVNQFQEFSPPTIFKFGFAFDPILDDKNILTASIQLNHPNDNSENISLGAEYRLIKHIFPSCRIQVQCRGTILLVWRGVARINTRCEYEL